MSMDNLRKAVSGEAAAMRDLHNAADTIQKVVGELDEERRKMAYGALLWHARYDSVRRALAVCASYAALATLAAIWGWMR